MGGKNNPETQKRWNAAHREQLREYKARHYAAHGRKDTDEQLAAKRANTRAWNAAHPELIREYSRFYQRRKAARKREAEAEADRKAQAALLARLAATCAHCGGQIVTHWGDDQCLQCGRAPVAARGLAPEERPEAKVDGQFHRVARLQGG